MGVTSKVGKRLLRWCPVCDGCGGWDKRTYKPRFRSTADTRDTYMNCIWCGPTNVIVRAVEADTGT